MIRTTASCLLVLLALPCAAAGPLVAGERLPLSGDPGALYWIGLPRVAPAAEDGLAARFDLRGRYDELSVARGDRQALANLRREVPGAFLLGEARGDERIYVISLAPGEELRPAVGTRTLWRGAQQAVVALPADGSVPVVRLLSPGRSALFHDGVARVPDRRQRPQPPQPARFRGGERVAAPAHDTRVQAWVDAVSPANLEADVTALSTLFTTRRSDTNGGRAAQDWLAARFQALGLATSLHSFDSGADNVIADLTGAVEPEKVVIVGAHYDSIVYSGNTAPGADDNASGTAALLEIARILTEQGAELRYTVRFAAFAAEEFGLVGSDAYSAMLRAQGVRVVSMLNTDMNAYRRAGDRLDLDMVTSNATPWLTDLVRAIAAVYVPELPSLEGGLAGGTSDHQSFYQDGFPAAFLFEDTGDYSPYIHTVNDVVGTSANDFALARQIVRALLASAAVLADPVDLAPPPLLSVTGSCPGTITVHLTGATPLGAVGLLAAFAPGTDYVPAGACAGTPLGLADPQPLALLSADGAGAVTVVRQVPAAACGRRLQAVDFAPCRESNVTAVP